MKILMVCLGNICRSPLAEGILKSKLPTDFVVDSAGQVLFIVVNVQMKEQSKWQKITELIFLCNAQDLSKFGILMSLIEFIVWTNQI